MKTLIIVIILSLIGCTEQLTDSSSQPKPLAACGFDNPKQQLSWLKDLIAKADEDRATMAFKGNYLGIIYLEKYQNQDVFWVEMMMNSGGLMGRAFQCEGTIIEFTNETGQNFHKGLRRDVVVYSNQY
ncbi:MAG: hypothetical protein EAZ14_06240 [Runella slithyformis]|jgi:hypothetical protein|nr:MAG: hypothetical protein EAZ50_08480 [Runella slithyformis]TAH12068.1 MAG: hypothetical protein EAZ14_06240 [Runella slithyformis]